MKVRDLRKKLSELDPESEVFGYTEDEKFLANGASFILFEFEEVTVSKAAWTRLNDNTPSLKFGEQADAKSIALLNVTSEF